MSAAPVGVLGGTFDPIHHAHLRLAEEFAERLGLERVVFIPAGRPWQRGAPGGSPDQRLAMARLAVAGNPRFSVDEREVRRDSPSYTVDTLTEMRREAPDQPLCLLLGADAFLNLPTWHRWTEVFALAHVGVAWRPGHEVRAEAMAQPLAREFAARRADDLAPAPAGSIACMAMTPLDISATRIRAAIAAGGSARYLLPENVLNYIQSNGLYRAAG